MNKELDKINKHHWRYNSDEDRAFYRDHRLAVDRMYKEAGSNVPFREMIDDPHIRGLEKKRQEDLREKIKDLQDMLSQGYIGSYQSVNPYYDNSVNARNIGYPENESAWKKMREDYDQFDKETEQLRKNRIVDFELPNPSKKYDWFSKR